MQRATSDYRAELDIIGQFVAERCIEEQLASEGADRLYQAYRRWAEETRTDQILSGRSFRESLVRRFQRKKDSQGNFYLGIRLLQIENLPSCY